jgi:PAS domain S-box-containing protein
VTYSTIVPPDMGPVALINVAITGMMAFAALHYFLMWRWSRRERVLLIFSLFSVVVGFSTASIIGVLAADSVTTAQTTLDLRTTFTILAFPLLVSIVSEIAAVRPGRILTFVTVACVTVSVLSAFGVPINGTVTAVHQTRLPWGETLAVVDRAGPLWAAPVYAVVLFVEAYVLFVGWRATHRDRLVGTVIILTGVAAVIATIVPLLVDVVRLPLPYVGTLQFALWVPVLSLLLSREYARRDERLAASEERYRILIESAPDAIVVLDLGAGRFVEFNQKAVDMFGWSPSELASKSPIDVSPEFQPDGRRSADVAPIHLREAVEGGTPFFEWMHHARDGREIPCEVRLARLPDPSRTLIRGSMTDISQRLQLEAQLRQAQKMEAVGQLAGGVAHDFNNLLTVIEGYCGMLLDKLPPEDPLRSDVRAIADAGHRAASLTQRLLTFSRRAVLTPKVVDVNDIVRETEHILRRLIGEDILLTVRLGPAGGHVKVDPGHLGQVLINLALNARDALPAGGKLTICTERADPAAAASADRPGGLPGRYVRLIVSDTGHGMSPDVKAHIFEPFFTTKGVGHGTGLGLAVVHGFVKQSGGYIDVESEEGVGTTFSISLPLVDEVPIVQPQAPAEIAAHGVETILIVEDEDAVRHLLAQGLRNYGFTVMTARDGAEALHLVRERAVKLDLLVTDVVMPNMSGRDLADRLRSEFAGLKVLFISGYTDDTLLRHGVYEARESFLQKPFVLRALASKVRETLDRN